MTRAVLCGWSGTGSALDLARSGTGLRMDCFEGARVLVTGGAGFVGSWVCERLLAEGAQVQCVDSLVTGSPDNMVTIADYDAHEYGVRLSGGGERSYQALGQAARLFEEGEFSMPVAQTFPLEQAAEAHRVSQDGHVRGKLVLVFDGKTGGA